MDFTQIYKHSLVSFSFGGQFILTALQDRLVVRRTDSLQIIATWLLEAPTTSKSPLHISHIGWSCDSEYLFAACTSLGFIDVFKLKEESWKARIEAGAEGLVKAEWAPDGRTLICTSEWGLRITLWSLVTGTATHIQYPVHSDSAYAFRADGRYFALAERHRSKDTLGVYDALHGYSMVRHFPLPTSNLGSLSLSPTGNYLAVSEGPLEFRLHIVTLAGSVVSSFSPDVDPGFGVRCVAWHPTGSLLAVAGRDNKVHILDNLSWTSVATLTLSSKLASDTIVWREPADWLVATEGRGFLSYEKTSGARTIPIPRVDMSKGTPKSGAVQLEWSKSGAFLLVRFESTPTVAHIYDFPVPDQPLTPRLRSVLIHTQPITNARWNPESDRIALCCGGQSIYIWSNEWVNEDGTAEDMAECVGIPAEKFDCRELKWSPVGKGLLLMSKDMFCCAFDVEEEEV